MAPAQPKDRSRFGRSGELPQSGAKERYIEQICGIRIVEVRLSSKEQAPVRFWYPAHLENLSRRDNGFPPEADQPPAEDFQVSHRA